MDSYDEDLTQNKWYTTLCEKHQELFVRATNERWMICIPRIGSWKSSIEDGDLFSQKSFESHILKPVTLYTGTTDAPQTQEDNKYITYNGKEVIIQGSKILCIQGFSYNFNQPSYDKKNENLVLNVESCHTSTILFEETFFNQNEESYPVLCISEPLEPHLVVVKKENENAEDLEQANPQRKVYGSYLWKRANHPKRLKQQIDEKVSQFVLHPLKLDENYAYEFISKEVTKSLIETVSNFLSSCWHIIQRDSKLKKLNDIPTEKENTTFSVEEYAMHGIYRSVCSLLNDLFAFHDCALNRITRNLSGITLSDLGIKEVFWPLVPRARRELSRINRYRLAKEKIGCLQNAIACLSSKPKMVFSEQSPVTTPVCQKSFAENAVAMTSYHEETAMSTDDLLPILVYLIITCDVANWLSNLCYLKHFHFTRTLMGNSNFCIATLEAALEHVRNGNVQHNKLSSFKRQNSKDDLEQFFTALKNGEIDAAKRFLRQAEDLKSLQEHDKCHPLCECSKCQLLSEKKSSGGSRSDIGINCRDEKGRTPLHIAALTGKHEMVEALISLDSDLNSSDYHGATPLHLASQEGNQSAIFLLLHHGAKPNAKDNNNNTPLHLACLGGHEACVKALLFYDPVSTVVKVNAANDVGDTPLHIASKWGYVSIVTCLMEYGGDPHQTNKRKVTPLNASITSRVSQALRYTEPTSFFHPAKNEDISQRAKPSKPLSKKLTRAFTVTATPNTEDDVVNKQVEKLLRAVMDNDVHMVSYVCGWNKDPKPEHERCHPLCQCFKCQPPAQDVCLHANSANSEGDTPLLIAAKQGYFEMATLLLKHGAKTNVKNKSKGHSPLHLAAQYGHEKIVKALLEANASSDTRDIEGNTPIYMSAMNGHNGCAKLLLKAHASVNLRNQRGNSPLHVAVRWKQGATACLLIANGALAYYKNKDGLTAIDLAKPDKEMTAILEKALEDHDLFKDDNFAVNEPSISTNQNSTKVDGLKNFTQSEADEQLVDEILDSQERLRTASTPPMVDVVLSENEDTVFEFDKADWRNDSFLAALRSPASINEVNFSGNKEKTEESLTETASEKVCDFELPISEETNIVTSSPTPGNASVGFFQLDRFAALPDSLGDLKLDSKNGVKDCKHPTDFLSSKQKGSYFEIAPKTLASDVRNLSVPKNEQKAFEVSGSAQTEIKSALKPDNDYLSFK